MVKIYSKNNATLALRQKPFLIGYLLAGYKKAEELLDLLPLIPRDTIDVLELGFPSKNPYSDGEVIANAHKSVNYEVSCSIEYWKKIREVYKKPIWVMAYREDFIASGIYKDFAKNSVVDAIVIPDTTNEERIKLQRELKPYNIDVVGFVNPSMDEKQMDEVLSEFTFIYEQLYVGQTGSSQSETNYDYMLNYTLNKYPSTIPFAGFGLNNKKKLDVVYSKGFKGAVIGTELLKRYNISKEELINFLIDVSRSKE
ncbi:MAG: tryptophan synthase subunit alpha [Pleomorphochaeta sp.]|jgi:tryptophan synthase alpha chain